MTIRDCPNCGGTHFGSSKCPYIAELCVICGDETVLVCSDCAIDSHGTISVHVCSKPGCREVHETALHPNPNLATPNPKRGARHAQARRLFWPSSLFMVLDTEAPKAFCLLDLRSALAEEIMSTRDQTVKEHRA